MQTQIDLSVFENSSGWHVTLCGESHLYIIKNERGQVMKSGKFTNRVFAETHLKEYLEGVQEQSQKAHDAKAAKKAEEAKAAKTPPVKPVENLTEGLATT